MSDSEAKKAWARDNMMLVGLKLHRKYDADLVEYLTSLADKKQATIKAALREYMERHEEMKGERKMKQYRIKPEFWSSWGNDVDENTIVDENEVKRLSCEWGIPVDDLMEQLDEVDA